MYYCEDCGKWFDFTKSRSEWQGEKEHGGYVSYEICPHCGSESFSDAPECAACECYVIPGKAFCHSCEMEIGKAMSKAFDTIDRFANIGNTFKAMRKWIEEKEKENVYL